MQTLPPILLDQLLTELSTLASVYHKPPSTFVGHGRYGAQAIQHAAIQEQRQEAVDNPIAAAAITATSQGTTNAENLLDIDFDGAAPASADAPPSAGTSGLEGLGGTPAGSRVSSPVGGGPGQRPAASSLDDMMGLFDSQGATTMGGGQTGQDDLMNGFAGMSMDTAPKPKATTEDLLGMF